MWTASVTDFHCQELSWTLMTSYSTQEPKPIMYKGVWSRWQKRSNTIPHQVGPEQPVGLRGRIFQHREWCHQVFKNKVNLTASLQNEMWFRETEGKVTIGKPVKYRHFQKKALEASHLVKRSCEEVAYMSLSLLPSRTNIYANMQWRVERTGTGVEVKPTTPPQMRRWKPGVKKQRRGRLVGNFGERFSGLVELEECQQRELGMGRKER